MATSSTLNWQLTGITLRPEVETSSGHPKRRQLGESELIQATERDTERDATCRGSSGGDVMVPAVCMIMAVNAPWECKRHSKSLTETVEIWTVSVFCQRRLVSWCVAFSTAASFFSMSLHCTQRHSAHAESNCTAVVAKYCNEHVCVSVCLPESISAQPHARCLTIFLCILPVAMTRSYSYGVTKSQGKEAISQSSPPTMQCTA